MNSSSPISELLAAPLSALTRAEINALIAPIPQPVLGMASDSDIVNAALRAGFSNCLVSHWEWATHDKITVDTSALGGIGPNGILVVTFTPNLPYDDNNLALISATGYPAPNMSNALTVCVSDQPCLLYADEPGTATDTSPTVVYGVGAVKKASWWSTVLQGVALTPGVPMYINVAGRDRVSGNTPWGLPTARPELMGYPNCDLRLEAQKPPGH